MTEIIPAARELATLAAVMRGWDYDETLAAVIAAKNAGWDFEQVFREVSRLLVQEDGAPSSLRNAARNPLRKDPVAEDTWRRGAALARHALEHRHEREDGSAA